MAKVGRKWAAGRPLWTTREERTVIDRAVIELRRACGDRTIREGRALELICADFLAQVDLERRQQ